MLKKAIEHENEQELIKYLDFRQTRKIDSSQYYLLEKALMATWHSQHEDLVATIWLEGLKDDRFVEPIAGIALNRETFRWYDDELESTLRKCVHALKVIDSEKSNQALRRLEKLNNNNIKTTLDMYK